MPELDGVQAQRLACSSRRGSHAVPKPLRVIVLTTFDLDDRAATAIGLGASGFLLKDTTPAQLADAIRTVHAGNAVLSADDLGTMLARRFSSPLAPAPRPSRR